MHTDTLVLELEKKGELGEGKIRISGYPEDVQLACGRELAQFSWGADKGDGQNWSRVEAEVADLAAAQEAIYSILPVPVPGSGAPDPSGWAIQTLMFSVPVPE